MNALARTSSNLKWQTILSSQRMLYKDYERRCSFEKKKFLAVSLKGLGAKTN
jgi:hypothetical protein